MVVPLPSAGPLSEGDPRTRCHPRAHLVMRFGGDDDDDDGDDDDSDGILCLREFPLCPASTDTP